MLHYSVSGTTGEAHRRWLKDSPVTPEMRQLMDVVAQLLDQGLFYTRDVYAAVVSRYQFTEDELARGAKRVENGVLGMEIYYARARLEMERALAAEAAARSRLKLAAGARLGSLDFARDRMRPARNIVVEEISPDVDARIRISFTSGNRRFHTTVRAVDIENAQARHGARRQALG